MSERCDKYFFSVNEKAGNGSKSVGDGGGQLYET
jgi:hypothetical protein